MQVFPRLTVTKSWLQPFSCMISSLHYCSLRRPENVYLRWSSLMTDSNEWLQKPRDEQFCIILESLSCVFVEKNLQGKMYLEDKANKGWHNEKEELIVFHSFDQKGLLCDEEVYPSILICCFLFLKQPAWLRAWCLIPILFPSFHTWISIDQPDLLVVVPSNPMLTLQPWNTFSQSLQSYIKFKLLNHAT